MASSGTIDHLVDRAVTRSSELDKAWLPSRFLEYVSHLGSFRGLGLDYDRRAFAETDLDSDDAPVAFLKMQLWGNKAAEVLEVLRGADAFPSETTLSKVKVKFWLTNADELFTLDDVKFDGKITARGTSFESHLDLTNQLYAVYAHSIKHIETEYSLATEHTGDSISLRGEPIHFSFSRPIQNLSAFCKSLCTAGPPFRLWGAPVSVTAALYRIHAVDLHVGSRVTLEVTNEFMRVYLPEDSCGNTVLRLLTNLQHHYDALVRATSADGEDILGLQLTHAQPLDRPL